MRAATVCSWPNCGNPATDGRGRCAEHTRKRGTTSQRGYGAEYQAKRRRFLRTHTVCACGQPATTIHHVRHDAGTPEGLNERYWQAACQHCNSSEAAAWATR